MPTCALLNGSTQLYGVIGWPLSQSLSPLLHNTAFATLGMSALYQRWEIPPEALPLFVQSVRLLHIHGCSVTIPHKTHLEPLLDNITQTAKRAGAVNTIFWREGFLWGDNTDVTGFMAPLERENLAGASVLLLGAGGAARAAAAGLTALPQAQRPAVVYVCTPSNTSHLRLAEMFSLTPLLWEDRHTPPVHLIINATPLGMRGKAEAETPFDFSLAPSLPSGEALAYDIVYNPLETRFLREAKAAGRRCISGLEMFIGQGNAQFSLWTGHGLPREAREALVTSLMC
ncbi:MAG: shikimate dehydrogenase [Desulfovibrio sp.]|nr:shikimate dehydrogenase [Desulfovibrio sp.]